MKDLIREKIEEIHEYLKKNKEDIVSEFITAKIADKLADYPRKNFQE